MGEQSNRRQYLWLLFLGTVLLCVLLNRLVLGHMPHGWDEVSYHFQGQVFADGRVWAPGSPHIECFWNANVVNRIDKRFSKYPPGWPLLLAPAMALRAPELANACLTGLTVILLWHLARRWWGEREAWITAALALLSPFFTFMGSNFLSHMPCAALLLSGLWAMIRSLEAPSARTGWLWALAAGACIAWAGLIRPYSAILGLAGNVWIAAWIQGLQVRPWLRLGLGSVPPALAALAILLGFNAATTGHPLLMGYTQYSPDLNFLGVTGVHRESILHNVAANVPQIARGLSRHIWGTPWLDLLPLLLLPLIRPCERTSWALTGAAALFCLAHSLYYYFDFYYGPRLVFETMPWILLGSGRTIALLPWPSRRLRVAVIAGVAGVLALGPVRLYALLCDYYATNYCGQGTALRDVVRQRRLSGAIVFLRAGPEANFAYATLSPLNAVELTESDVLYARFVPESVGDVMRLMPGREAWILDVTYEPIPGFSEYADRFRLTRAVWQRVSSDPEEWGGSFQNGG